MDDRGTVIARNRIMSDPKTDPVDADAFSPMEEEFFRAGDAISAATSAESCSDSDAAPAPRGLWSRLFKRTRRAATERPSLAIARVRHSTGM